MGRARTPLAQAVLDLDLDELKRLVASGTDINGADEGEFTALHTATMVQYDEKANNIVMMFDRPAEDQAMLLEIVKFLVDSGADVNAQTQVRPQGRACIDALCLTVGRLPCCWRRQEPHRCTYARSVASSQAQST